MPVHYIKWFKKVVSKTNKYSILQMMLPPLEFSSGKYKDKVSLVVMKLSTVHD
jgi:hypothetical protein